MRIIAEFEKEKAEKAVAKAAKKKQRTEKKVKRREDALHDVINMIIQEILDSQDPPLQFHDQDHNPILRKLKPSFTSCKNFMQVTM